MAGDEILILKDIRRYRCNCSGSA